MCTTLKFASKKNTLKMEEWTLYKLVSSENTDTNVHEFELDKYGLLYLKK